ncbi:integral membrane protein [Rathayibacter sp. PhB127]|uniref:DUF3817 domain-containing protein n=1 Tax=Rathayibacter sp. PhB127 TaxID=2485176 RepID=UPI000F90CDA1|nr:DUF3817 domain-containing protein [Rathayibacter sp. PhB127]ROS30028.1 integral membrane protein [Rathayibacter sp. PhB127]
MSDPARLPWISRIFIIAAILEAFTWAGLLVGMLLKYVTKTTDVGVSIFGALHGGMFLVYAAVAIITAITLRWTWRLTAIALIAAVPPLVTIPLELALRRTGRLAPRATPQASSTNTPQVTSREDHRSIR